MSHALSLSLFLAILGNAEDLRGLSSSTGAGWSFLSFGSHCLDVSHSVERYLGK